MWQFKPVSGQLREVERIVMKKSQLFIVCMVVSCNAVFASTQDQKMIYPMPVESKTQEQDSKKSLQSNLQEEAPQETESEEAPQETESQEEEPHGTEVQGGETQEAGAQGCEAQKREVQEAKAQDAEAKGGESQGREVQDDETKEMETQEQEPQENSDKLGQIEPTSKKGDGNQSVKPPSIIMEREETGIAPMLMYSVPEYYVVIPERLDETSSLTVSWKSFMDDNSLSISIQSKNGFKMTDDATGQSVDYLLFVDSIEYQSPIVFTGNNGSEEIILNTEHDVAKYTGVYTDTLTFTTSFQ